MVPSVPTSATLCRSPITPCSAMGRYALMCTAEVYRIRPGAHKQNRRRAPDILLPPPGGALAWPDGDAGA